MVKASYALLSRKLVSHRVYTPISEKQTVEFNIKARVDFKSKKRARMSVWEAMEMLNTLVDESDPDTDLSQIEHLLQTAEAIRRDGKPEWMQVTGLVHDLGKLLSMFGSQGQWDVVGDTFVVGCKFSDKNIYPHTFEANPDSKDAVYSTECGIYEPHCGLENVMLSWGHDEVSCSFPTPLLPETPSPTPFFHSSHHPPPSSTRFVCRFSFRFLPRTPL
jgi:inositol oxygenase